MNLLLFVQTVLEGRNLMLKEIG
ncbi:hypothetical protein CL3_12260 [butyrate-producing bacterium SM4/1]|nr:hypothetical protein CL3_12260 [butyrate-producing bacterium SM4/1]